VLSGCLVAFLVLIMVLDLVATKRAGNISGLLVIAGSVVIAIPAAYIAIRGRVPTRLPRWRDESHCMNTKMAHQWGPWDRESGSCNHTKTCEICGEKMSRLIHDWVEKGSQRNCLNCGVSTDIPGYWDAGG
jgi:hypothetical protein